VQPALGDPAWAGGGAGGPTEVPSNPNHSVILLSHNTTAPPKPASASHGEAGGQQQAAGPRWDLPP